MDVERKLEDRQQKANMEIAGERLLSHKLGSRLALFSQFPSKSRLEKSKIYQSLRTELEQLTHGIEYGCYADAAKMPGKPFYRAVSWDLHHGLEFEGVEEVLLNHPI